MNNDRDTALTGCILLKMACVYATEIGFDLTPFVYGNFLVNDYVNMNLSKAFFVVVVSKRRSLVCIESRKIFFSFCTINNK